MVYHEIKITVNNESKPLFTMKNHTLSVNQLCNETIHPMNLSPDEQEFLLLLSQELTLEEIGTEMKLSLKQTEQLLKAMLRKFEAKSEVGLVKQGIKKGIVENR